MSGWGLKYFDYDNDGLIDLILANGHPDDMIDSYSMQVTLQRAAAVVSPGFGWQAARRERWRLARSFQKDLAAARGLAVGDYDNDGAVDVIIGVNGGRPVLLKNNAAKGNNWLGLKLEGVTCNRDAIGARMVWKSRGQGARAA
jgi:hypothetical protein